MNPLSLLRSKAFFKIEKIANNRKGEAEQNLIHEQRVEIMLAISENYEKDTDVNGYYKRIKQYKNNLLFLNPEYAKAEIRILTQHLFEIEALVRSQLQINQKLFHQSPENSESDFVTQKIADQKFVC